MRVHTAARGALARVASDDLAPAAAGLDEALALELNTMHKHVASLTAAGYLVMCAAPLAAPDGS